MKYVNNSSFILFLLGFALVSCESELITPKEDVGAINQNPYLSTYKPRESSPTLLQNVSMYDGVGGFFETTNVRVANGLIAAIGKNIVAAEGDTVVDGVGMWLTPGIIDVHSHMGVYPSIDTLSHADGNEVTGPNTAEVWAEHGIWPQDPTLPRAIAGGVTSAQILPGSANLFGGRSVVIKIVPARIVQEMKFPGAPYGMKMACGENPKRVYGDKGGPYSRMGNVAGYRKAWTQATAYKRKWDDYHNAMENGESAEVPDRDIQMDTLMGVLNGDILVHMHCYRADDMGTMMDLMKEFNYQITSFQHAVESYKIGDLLAENNVCSAMWADWWGFKMEAYDGVRENIPLVHSAGACAIVHSDSEEGIQYLNQEAAKAWSDGNRAGLNISKAEAWKWLTSNPAKSLGIFDKVGSIEVGKQADLALWDKEPFSVYSRANKVYVDGALLFDRNSPESVWVTDFELGQPGFGDMK